MAITNFSYSPNQPYLFGRSWSVAFGPEGQANAVSYDQLRIKFDVDKNTLGTSNKAKIEIYNLSTESRQKIQKGWNILLKAGYGKLLETLFIGGILFNGVKSKRDGSDIITSLECGDGEASIVLATLDKSYPGGTTLAQVLQDLATNMGVGIGGAIGIPALTFNKGYVVHGSISLALNDLCKTAGLTWNVNNGSLNIIPVNGYDGQQAQLVSKKTGMIGVPSSDGQVMQFTSLLNTRLVPNSVVQMDSDNTALNGFYKIRRAHYEGDSHDQKWQVACECLSFPNLSNKLPASTGSNFNTAVIS